MPRLKVTDGPVGARGESYTTTTSALFPCGSALGATFDPDLVERVGAAIADEARTKAAHVLLGPTINLIRHPLGGRNFEAYSEDPTLDGSPRGRLRARRAEPGRRGLRQALRGQRRRDRAAHDQQRRGRADVARGLPAARSRPPCAMASVWTVMASYNRINGTFGCEHPWLLSTVLKEEWGFDGLVMSDWFATHATVEAALAGLDLEMPGPAQHFGAPLAAAVEAGEVPRHVVVGAGSSAAAAPRPGGRRPRRAPRRPPSTIPTDGGWPRETSAAAMVLLRNADVAARRARPAPRPGRAAARRGDRPQRRARPSCRAAAAPGSRRIARSARWPGCGTGWVLGVTVEYEPGALRGQVPVLDGRHARTDCRARHRDVVRRGGRRRGAVRQHRSQPRCGVVGAVRARCRSAALPPPRRGHRRGRSLRAPRAQRHVDRAVPGAARPRDGARHGERGPGSVVLRVRHRGGAHHRRPDGRAELRPRRHLRAPGATPDRRAAGRAPAAARRRPDRGRGRRGRASRCGRRRGGHRRGRGDRRPRPAHPVARRRAGRAGAHAWPPRTRAPSWS